MTCLVDSHCHLSSLSLKGKYGATLEEFYLRARHAGVTHFLCVACTPDEHKIMLEKISGFENIFTSCGVHPLNLQEAGDWTEKELISCLKVPSTIALGETGLDYHYAKDSAFLQQDSFARQIALALELKLPLIIHTREAKKDTISLMQEHNAIDAGGVMHCFCEDKDMAKKCLDMGFYISFSGIVTFKAGDNVREAASYVPVDRMLVETDCPYLAPVPVRGVENEPAFVRYTLEFLADLKGLTPGELADITSKNFSDLFAVTLNEPQSVKDYPVVSQGRLEPIFDKDFLYPKA